MPKLDPRLISTYMVYYIVFVVFNWSIHDFVICIYVQENEYEGKVWNLSLPIHTLIKTLTHL